MVLSSKISEILKRNMLRAMGSGKLNEAGEILEKLKAEAPLALETRGLELEYLLRTRQLEEAGALADQLCRLFPESGRIKYLAGQAAYKEKKYEQAAALFDESNRMYPHQRTRQWLGKTYTQLGRFDEALALLEECRHNPAAQGDLAWLYERKGELETALEHYESFLEHYPDNAYIQERMEKLKARLLEPEELLEEMESLESLGEEVPPNLLSEFIKRLFETGESQKAREVLEARLPQLDGKTAVDLGWVCHRAQAYDMAVRIFMDQLTNQARNIKFLVTLESDARLCGRSDDLLAAYEELAPKFKNLYGRIKRLSK